MYTQCPECAIAFKVTADVLKQAAGMVRCGGCANAFNALAFLSESMPRQIAANNADAAVPELTPEIIETDSPPPQTIPAEQSAALLKTLDQLAGSDIRIEDTGVEWRVLDDDEVAGSAADDVFLDEPLEASATPIDEVLKHSPEVVDAAEVFDATANGMGKTTVDEIRFDDNTPLPDDFDLDDESSYVAQAASEPRPEAVVEVEPPGEFALSEPEEWTDILDEFEDLGAEFATADDDEIDVEDSDTDTTPDDDMAVSDPVSEPETTVDASEAAEDDRVLDLVDELEQALASEASEEISHLDVVEEQVEPIIESHTIEEELAMLEGDESNDDLSDDFNDESHGEDTQHVAPMTDEEHTVNMQIDQELMALAVEDEDGFASTMVIPGGETGANSDDDKPESAAERRSNSNDAQGFESIVMEGEFVRSALDDETMQDESGNALQLSDIVAAGDAGDTEHAGRRHFALLGGVVGLVVLLALQTVHQSREALATIPAFSSTIGQIYEAIGQPVQPAWDIRAWRIEATSDTIAVSEGTENLTISSRIGNNSDTAMPYPLISLSLSDRFLETIGSQILEPSEYLTTDLDPDKQVAAGNTFNAVMSIESPSTEATGYKLDVCYRLTDGRLRCAIDDFK